MALYPRLLTSSDNCILRVLERSLLGSFLLGLTGLASWPGPVLLPQCRYFSTRGGSTRQGRSSLAMQGGTSLLAVAPGCCQVTAYSRRHGHTLVALCCCTSPPLPPLARSRHTEKHIQIRPDVIAQARARGQGRARLGTQKRTEQSSQPLRGNKVQGALESQYWASIASACGPGSL